MSNRTISNYVYFRIPAALLLTALLAACGEKAISPHRSVSRM